MNLKCNATNCTFNKASVCTQDEIEINFTCGEYEYAYCNKYEESIESARHNYEIIKLENKDYDYFILSKSYMNISDYLSYIGKDLKILNKNTDNKVRILTDGLLAKGNNSNRYIEFEWDFTIDDIREIHVVTIQRDNEFRKMSTDYYKTHPELIEYSILTSVQKKLILKGIVI